MRKPVSVFYTETGTTTTEVNHMVADIMVAPDAQRDAAAAEIARNGILWHVVTLKVPHGAFPPGSVFYAVPSCTTEGASYLTNRVYCSCPDYKRAVCKHIRAVILFLESKVRPARQGYASLYPTCWTPGCTDDPEPGEGGCYRHANADAF